jgi:3',5'-cyclic-AMP phosphodiesterase
MIFMHHPPLRIGIRSLDSICLLPRARFTEMILPYKEWVRLVCFGHVHRPVSGTWRGIPFSGMKGIAYQCMLDFAAIDQPPGSHEPPAYGIILSNANSTVVHARDFLDAGLRFDFAQRPQGDQILSRMDAAE